MSKGPVVDRCERTTAVNEVSIGRDRGGEQGLLLGEGRGPHLSQAPNMCPDRVTAQGRATTGLGG